ncbi:triose-phosphate isomerase [Roseitalea porphyridii]|uniref:Triosephosphate isomerase n=1 Tax=Roseitalea porphyridii TaxID=1852022 RepID=A0A4P6V293_9HYPH|nr:triose-phosphate isomerase [Roseitalea porphyridii]QBK30824.1 triose-phosphate isomerase [Roseitalea porphyridii]
MADPIRPLIAGNWKMHGTGADLPELKRIANGVDGTKSDSPYDAVICTPATLIDRAVRTVVGSPLAIGGQDCHHAEKGAHTGDVSPAMLVEAGASYVIVGHSERRADHGESDADVLGKANGAHAAGMTAIVCVGETREEREAGRAEDVVDGQLAWSVPEDARPDDTVIAYEPVWAIGTGLTPSMHDIETMHDHMRMQLKQRFGSSGARFRLLYGGSVKPANAADIFAISSVDGALIGGASLKSDDFLAICAAMPAR